MRTNKIFLCLFTGLIIFILNGCGPKYSIDEQETYALIMNQGGQTLGYAPASGVTLIKKNRYAFKDLNKNGELDAYEDWRMPVDERINNLVGQMSV